MNIKILGTGCANCQKLKKTVNEVIQELGVNADVEEVKDMKKIMQYPILATPGLVINEKLITYGKVPSKAEVTTFITTVLADA